MARRDISDRCIRLVKLYIVFKTAADEICGSSKGASTQDYGKKWTSHCCALYASKYRALNNHSGCLRTSEEASWNRTNRRETQSTVKSSRGKSASDSSSSRAGSLNHFFVVCFFNQVRQFVKLRHACIPCWPSWLRNRAPNGRFLDSVPFLI